eukprot:6199733-Amphidinium_carterae.1
MFAPRCENTWFALWHATDYHDPIWNRSPQSLCKSHIKPKVKDPQHIAGVVKICKPVTKPYKVAGPSKTDNVCVCVCKRDTSSYTTMAWAVSAVR